MRTGDGETGLQRIFDADKLQREINAQVAITQAFTREAPKAAATFLDNQIKDLKDQLGDQSISPAKRAQLEQGIKDRSEGGIIRIAVHTLMGAMGGGVSGALGAAASASAAPLINQLQDGITVALKDAGLGDTAAKGIASGITGLTAAGVGAAVGGTQGAATSFTVDVNNRQLHPSETQRIKELANGDPRKQARLTQAACALVRCADGVPKDDANYAYLKAMQDAGATLQDEQKTLLAQQSRPGDPTRTFGPLFRYTGVDEYIIDPATQNKLGTRLAGAVQAGAGLAGVAGSGALCTTGVGCVAGAVTGTVSADYAQAGAKQAVTGNAAVPYGEQVLQSLGLSPQAAAITYGVLGVAPAVLPAIGQAFIKVAPQLDASLINAGAKIGQNIDDVAASLARNSTQVAGNTDRVVLGEWKGNNAGYVGEAKLNGGTWYQTDTGVFEKMTAGLNALEKEAVAWKVNEYFLAQQMQKGIAKFEFTGLSPDAIKAVRPDSFAAREVLFLEKNGSNYGYVREGSTWVKK